MLKADTARNRLLGIGLVSITVICFSVLAPFPYPQIVWMTPLGWLAFGDVPGWPVIGGAAVVVASGRYLIGRERAVDRRRPAEALG